MNTIKIDFDKPIYVVSFKNDKVLRKLSATRGLQVMGQSTRWDDQHATFAIRVLHESMGLGTEPVYFSQAKPVVQNLEMVMK